MDTIDWDAREKAWKALTTIIIFLIIVENIHLLIKIVRAAGGPANVLMSPRGPRFQTFISLIIGDILVALFPLVIQAMMLFDNIENISCESRVLSQIYLIFIMPFVYGMGLVVLAVECILFRKRMRAASPSRDYRSAIISLAVGSVPWILGVTVALPLCMAGVDYCAYGSTENTLTVGRQRAMISVCLLLPVALDFVFAFANLQNDANPCEPSTFLVLDQCPTTTQQRHTNILLNAPSVPAQPSAPCYESPPSYEEVQQGIPNLQPISPVETYSQTNPLETRQQHPRSDFDFAFDQNNLVSYGHPQYRQAQPSHFCQQPHPNQPEVQGAYLPAGSITYTAPEIISDTLSDQRPIVRSSSGLDIHYSVKEKAASIFAVVIFSVCVAPYAIFHLVYSLSENRPNLSEAKAVIFSDLVFFILIIRACLLPLGWIHSGSFNRMSLSQ
ncbi:hypothetical protein PoB_004104500 [Plakobranchus ocellatus]|uniref:G-protein coupled receptors family 1 profile domain-containing protein n=1 Tax=Plakobranchus ocellatus TaxID=259542 RepID=A0AAV4B4L3_9GAST|nr:hypothetical protein PoB_004104500 [Plakobranchus ocellatus]